MIFNSLFTFFVGKVHLFHVSLIVHPSNRAERERIEMPTNKNNDNLRTQITNAGKGSQNLLAHNNDVWTQITTFEKGSQNLLKHTELSLHLFHGRSSHLIQRGTGCFAALEVRRLGRLLGRFLVHLGRFLVLLGRFLVLLGLLFGVLEVGLGLFLKITCSIDWITPQKTIKIFLSVQDLSPLRRLVKGEGPARTKKLKSRITVGSSHQSKHYKSCCDSQSTFIPLTFISCVIDPSCISSMVAAIIWGERAYWNLVRGGQRRTSRACRHSPQ